MKSLARLCLASISSTRWDVAGHREEQALDQIVGVETVVNVAVLCDVNRVQRPQDGGLQHAERQTHVADHLKQEGSFICLKS